MAQGSTDTARAIRDKALTDPTAYAILESLTTEVGARPAGSQAQIRARDWGLAKLRELGFSNVHAEPFPLQYWARGPESAEITGPYPQALTILGLGRSPSTPPGGIEAPIVVFDAYADLLAAPEGSLAGKIAMVNEPMVRTQDGSGYGAINAARTRGADEASKRGAVAYLVRSLSTDDTDLPHTGAMVWLPGVRKIPAAAVSVPDADVLARMYERGQPVTVKLSLQSTEGDATGWNVVGELPGTHPDEIIVIGGHLDSWDVGTGAVDDGAGVAVTIAAANLAASAGQNRRTIRVVMFGAEEMDFSGAAYAAAHKDELPKIVLTSESDEGADGVFALRLPPGGGAAFSALPSLLAPLKIDMDRQAATGAGSDVAGLIAGGVPPFSFRIDATRYFDLHHSNDDTLNKVEPAKMNQMVAAWATLLYLAANSDQDFRAAP